MTHPQLDAYLYASMLCLPLVAWAVGTDPVWRRLRPVVEPRALRVWHQVVLAEPEPTELDLHRVAVAHVTLLRVHLARVSALLADDLWMTRTRQVGNRLAYAQLVVDLREAEARAAAYGPVEEVAVPQLATPTYAPTRLTYTAPSTQPAVEVIDLGPSRRWS